MVSAVTTIASAARSADQTKLQVAARDFESILIADLLQSAPKAASLDGGEEGSGVEGYDDLRTEAMATALAAQRGIGIARMLLKQLGPEAAQSDIKGFSSSADHVIAGESTGGGAQ